MVTDTSRTQNMIDREQILYHIQRMSGSAVHATLDDAQEVVGWLVPAGESFRGLQFIQDLTSLLLEPQTSSVPMPASEDQAALMCLLGENWLRNNAPGRLRATDPTVSLGWRPIAEVPLGQEVLLRGGIGLMSGRPAGRRVGIVYEHEDIFKSDGSLRNTAPTEWHPMPEENP